MAVYELRSQTTPHTHDPYYRNKNRRHRSTNSILIQKHAIRMDFLLPGFGPASSPQSRRRPHLIIHHK